MDVVDMEGDYGTVDLGFVEKCDPWRLQSHFFPSKVGGKPAWLDLRQLPTAEALRCDVCGGPCIFLCQIYAPIEQQDDCFHRTLYLFLCPQAECCQPNDNKNLKVLRCQLPRRNEFFSFDPPIESEHWKPEVMLENLTKVCNVCNLRGTSHCSKCRKTNYCSRQHQVADWKAGHKSECNPENVVCKERVPPMLLSEWEIVTESEPLTEELRGPKVEKSDEEKLSEYQRLVQDGQAGTLHGDAEAESDLAAMAENKADPIFKNFKKRISLSPNQVLRYEMEGQPLWMSQKFQPNFVPACGICGCERVFECQILPQMLNYLKLDQVEKSIDWGTLAIFTCSKNCSAGDAYKFEYVVKQDLVE